MEITPDIKLFIVKFGKPDRGDGFYSFGGNGEAVFYILATDYGQACQKAVLAYEEWKSNRPILSYDGSLNLPQNGHEEENFGIKEVKLACDKIIY